MLYNIDFYKNADGTSEVEEYLNELRADHSKDSLIKLEKITAYLDALEELGPLLHYPFARKLNNFIFELRPLKDRFLYSFMDEYNIIILSRFYKSSQKTP